MINISVSLVKELREKSGAGMMDCKKALIQSNGDVNTAIDLLKKKGMLLAEKKAGRSTKEGAISIQVSPNHRSATMLELSSETDFVAKNEKFHKLLLSSTDAFHNFNQLSESSNTNTEDHFTTFKESGTINGVSFQDLMSENIAVIGENLNLNRGIKVKLESSNGFVASYLHNAIAPNIGKIGVILAIKTEKITEELQNLAKQIAMHIAAMKPIATTIEDLDPKLVQKERQLVTERSQTQNQKPFVIEKMVQGRMQKWYEEVVLLEQNFVISTDKKKVKEALQEIAAKIGCEVTIEKFFRLEVGEEN